MKWHIFVRGSALAETAPVPHPPHVTPVLCHEPGCKQLCYDEA